MATEPALAVPHLRLVAPLLGAPWLADRFRPTAIEVWDVHLRLYYARLTSPPVSESEWPEDFLDCTIEDDLGTVYRRAKESLSSCSSHHDLDHGAVEFYPGPPSEAGVLSVRGPHGVELATVELA